MDNPSNLLKETLRFMTECGKSQYDVDWVGSRDGRLNASWEGFAELADKEYDKGYGGQEVSAYLVIVFKDGSWLERHEYDGSEWWEYKKTPTRPPHHKVLQEIFMDDYVDPLEP